MVLRRRASRAELRYKQKYFSMGKCNEPANNSEKKDIQQTSSSPKGWVQKELSWVKSENFHPSLFQLIKPNAQCFYSLKIFSNNT